jgi:hypothetical protein
MKIIVLKRIFARKSTMGLKPVNVHMDKNRDFRECYTEEPESCVSLLSILRRKSDPN